jgi:hypothetical protein
MEKQFLDEGDRKEAFDLLGRLEPRERSEFLAYCCTKAKSAACVTSSTGELLEVWADMIVLIAGPFYVSPRLMFETLRELVRRKR